MSRISRAGLLAALAACARMAAGVAVFRAGRVVVATLSNVERPSDSYASDIKATADLRLSRAVARAINDRLGKHTVSAGTLFATGALSATAGP